MHRACLLAALIGCARNTAPPAAPAPAPPTTSTTAPPAPAGQPSVVGGDPFNAYLVQHRPAEARLLAEDPRGRDWHQNGWSVWWHDGALWVHRVTCGECRAVQGWTWVVPLEDPDAWRAAVHFE